MLRKREVDEVFLTTEKVYQGILTLILLIRIRKCVNKKRVNLKGYEEVGNLKVRRSDFREERSKVQF